MNSVSISPGYRNGQSVTATIGWIRLDPSLATLLRPVLPTHALRWDRHTQSTQLVYHSAAECEAMRLWLYALIGQLEQLRDQLSEVGV